MNTSQLRVRSEWIECQSLAKIGSKVMPTPMVHGAADMEAGNGMTSFLSWLMSPQDYMPHGMCFLWQPELIALHVASDSLIALSYYSIPIALIYFVLKRTDLAFPSIFVLTGLFILACGTTHAMSVWPLWYSEYAGGGASEHGAARAGKPASWRRDWSAATR